MKSSTYGFFVMLAMLKELGAEYKSIKELLEATDNIANDMNCKPNFSSMTKYNIIRDLGKNGLLVLYGRGNKTYDNKTGNRQNVKVGLEIDGNVEKFIIKVIESADLEED